MIAGLSVSDAGRVEFAPVLPAELGPRFDLEGLEVGGMKIDLHIRGCGENMLKCTIDDEAADEAALDVSPGSRKVEIELGE